VADNPPLRKWPQNNMPNSLGMPKSRDITRWLEDGYMPIVPLGSGCRAAHGVTRRCSRRLLTPGVLEAALPPARPADQRHRRGIHARDFGRGTREMKPL